MKFGIGVAISFINMICVYVLHAYESSTTNLKMTNSL